MGAEFDKGLSSKLLTLSLAFQNFKLGVQCNFHVRDIIKKEIHFKRDGAIKNSQERLQGKPLKHVQDEADYTGTCQVFIKAHHYNEFTT